MIKKRDAREMQYSKERRAISRVGPGVGGSSEFGGVWVVSYLKGRDEGAEGAEGVEG